MLRAGIGCLAIWLGCTSFAAAQSTVSTPGAWDSASAWNSVTIAALAVYEDTLYVVGGFDRIGTPNTAGTARIGIASIDLNTHTLSTWNPCSGSSCPGIVEAKVSRDGTLLFVGGSFTTMAGVSRNHIAAINTSTGAVTAWQASTDPGTVEKIAISTTHVYTYASDGSPRVNAYAIMTGTLNASFTPHDPGGTIRAFEVSTDGSTLYLGGNSLSWDFTGNAPTPTPGCAAETGTRSFFAAVSTSNGCTTAFAPQPRNGTDTGAEPVFFVLPDGNDLYVGGQFERISGATRSHIARYIGGTTLDPSFVPPTLSDSVRELALVGERLYALGTFSDAGGEANRDRIAAFNATTGALDTTWTVPNDMAGGGTTMEIAGYVAGNEVYMADRQTTTPVPGPGPGPGLSFGGVTGVDLCVGVTCMPSDQCHVAGTCDSLTGECSDPAAGNGTSCDDDDACTMTDTCQSGVCTGDDPVVCAPSDQCHIAGICSSSTGVCSDPAASNGMTCSDDDDCTQSDSCQSGDCVGMNPVICTPLDSCHLAGTCDPSTGMCSNPANPDCLDGGVDTGEDMDGGAASDDAGTSNPSDSGTEFDAGDGGDDETEDVGGASGGCAVNGNLSDVASILSIFVFAFLCRRRSWTKRRR